MTELPADPFGRRCERPSGFTREDRVRLVAEVADALLAGEIPSAPARLFVGAALSGWLAEGGRLGALERDFLHVAAPARSTATPSRLWARLRSDVRGTGDGDADTVVPSPSPESGP